MATRVTLPRKGEGGGDVCEVPAKLVAKPIVRSGRPGRVMLEPRSVSGADHDGAYECSAAPTPTCFPGWL